MVVLAVVSRYCSLGGGGEIERVQCLLQVACVSRSRVGCCMRSVMASRQARQRNYIPHLHLPKFRIAVSPHREAIVSHSSDSPHSISPTHTFPR
jgi:hypothetical protein